MDVAGTTLFQRVWIVASSSDDASPEQDQGVAMMSLFSPDTSSGT